MCGLSRQVVSHGSGLSRRLKIAVTVYSNNHSDKLFPKPEVVIAILTPLQAFHHLSHKVLQDAFACTAAPAL